MANIETHIVAGTIRTCGLDKFGQRLFLVVRDGMHVGFGNRVITGGQVIRVLGGNTNFEQEISEDVSIAARLATPEELEGHAPEHLTDPTLTAEKLVTFAAIQKRAFELFQSGNRDSAEGNWLRAERELLAS